MSNFKSFLEAQLRSNANSKAIDVGGYTSERDPGSRTSHRNSEFKAVSTEGNMVGRELGRERGWEILRD